MTLLLPPEILKFDDLQMLLGQRHLQLLEGSQRPSRLTPKANV